MSHRTIKIQHVSCLVLGLMLCACQYSLVSLKEPNRYKVKKIAVEPPIIRSAEALAYEEIWLEFQRQLLRDRRLRIVPLVEAEAVLRMTVSDVSHTPAGTTINNDITPQNSEIRKDLDITAGSDVRSPLYWRNQGVSSSYSLEEILSVGLFVELFKIGSGKKLFGKKYLQAEQFRALSNIGKDQMSHLHYMENKKYHTRYLAKNIADRFLHDLFL